MKTGITNKLIYTPSSSLSNNTSLFRRANYQTRKKGRKTPLKHFSQVFDNRTDDAALILTLPILFGNCKKIAKLDIGVKFPERRLFKNGK